MLLKHQHHQHQPLQLRPLRPEHPPFPHAHHARDVEVVEPAGAGGRARRIPIKPTSGKYPSYLATMESKSLLAPASKTICKIRAWPRTTASPRVLLPRHHGNSLVVPEQLRNKAHGRTERIAVQPAQTQLQATHSLVAPP